MTPTPKRAPRSRDLQLSLTALLAFLSWAGLLAFFVVIPLLYLQQKQASDSPSLQATWALSAPMVMGGACVVVILFLLYYLMASNLRCQVCGGPVFGGGDTHRKHPNARKFLALSYSRQVAWEILTRRGFHCMHCQTFCRNRRMTQAAEDATQPISREQAPPVFQPMPMAAPPGTLESQNLFNTLFAPQPIEPPNPPMNPPSPHAPFSAPAPAVPSPFSMATAPLSGQAPAAVIPLGTTERTPWAHHAEASPFLPKPAAVNPPTIAAPTVPPAPFPPPKSPSAAAPIPVQPRPNQIPQQSPFAMVSQGPSPVHPQMPPAHTTESLPPIMSHPATYPAAPTAPTESVTPAPLPPTVRPTAPAPSGPSPTQVVTQVTRLIEKTRVSMDEMFSNMLGELKKVLESPAPAAERPQPAPVALPVDSPRPAEAAFQPPPAAPAPPQPVQPPRPVAAPITLPSMPGMTPPKPQVPAATVPPAAMADKAAEMNAVLARAFAQSQRPSEPAAPAPLSESAPAADWRTGHPQSPFSLVMNPEESPRPAPVAASAPLPMPPNVLPFPPVTSPAASLPSPMPASQAPQPPVFTSAPQLPPLPAAPAAAAVSPFAVMQSAPSAPAHPSPFANLPELHQSSPGGPPMPAPFTFLAQNGDQFVPDPTKAPQGWVNPVAPAEPPAADQQALQFAQMQAQQLAQFQALQQAQYAAQQGGQPPMPPPFMPQWPTQNGNGSGQH